MSPSERRQGAEALRAILTALLAAGGNKVGQEGADLRRSVGDLSTNAADRIEAGDFGADLRACFEAATAAGATFDGMDRVRVAASAFTADLSGVQNVVQASIRFALAQMGILLAATSFASRTDVDAALLRVNAAFEPAEEFAADARDNVVYRALIALHAAITRDLTQRARPLPRVVSYSVGRRLPALTLSNRLYGDGGRASELVSENKIVHPLFASGSGRALAN